MIEFVLVDAAFPQARWAMTQYFDELDQRFAGGFEVGAALDEAAAAFNSPRGRFVLALDGDEVAGCGAVQFLDEQRAEIKRMWVNPAARGRGLGARLLARLEDEVAQAGRVTVLLDTNGTLTEAISLYGKAGYREVPDYNSNPYAQLWFEKQLGRSEQ